MLEKNVVEAWPEAVGTRVRGQRSHKRLRMMRMSHGVTKKYSCSCEVKMRADGLNNSQEDIMETPVACSIDNHLILLFLKLSSIFRNSKLNAQSVNRGYKKIIFLH